MKIQSGIYYPKIASIVNHIGFQVGVILLTLFLVIYYNVAYYLYIPLTGVWLSYADSSFTSIQIGRIDVDSPGDNAGLQHGDKIISIDGRKITNLNSPLHKLKRAGEIELYVVERAGQELKFPLIVDDYLRNPTYLLNVFPSQLLSLLMSGLS